MPEHINIIVPDSVKIAKGAQVENGAIVTYYPFLAQTSTGEAVFVKSMKVFLPKSGSGLKKQVISVEYEEIEWDLRL